MKKTTIAISIIMTGLMIGSVNAATLGYIDIQKVFSSYEKTKTALEQLKKKEQSIKEEMAIKQKQVDKTQEKGASDADIKRLVDALEKEMEPKRKEIVESKQRTMFEIQNDIIRATEATAKKMGIETVLDKQVFIMGGVDITDKVIELLNKKATTK
jgi:Skp family chaperone for outer membrane proteins